MKISDLKPLSDSQLISLAKKIGDELHGNSTSGLIFSAEIKRMTFTEYANHQDDPSNPTVDTFDYVFYPSTGKGLDASDDVLTKEHVDKDGQIYLAGAEGVLILSEPFSTVKPKEEFDQQQFAAFTKEVVKHFPSAMITDEDKYGRIFAYSGRKLVGQFQNRNDRTDNKAGWLVYNDSNTLAKHNW